MKESTDFQIGDICVRLSTPSTDNITLKRGDLFVVDDVSTHTVSHTEGTLFFKNIRLAHSLEIKNNVIRLLNRNEKFPLCGCIKVASISKTILEKLVYFLNKTRYRRAFDIDFEQIKYLTWNGHNYWGVIAESSKPKYSIHYLLTGYDTPIRTAEGILNLTDKQINYEQGKEESINDIPGEKNARSSGERAGRAFVRCGKKQITTAERLIGHSGRIERSPKKIGHFEIRNSSGLYCNIKLGIGSRKPSGGIIRIADTPNRDVPRGIAADMASPGGNPVW